MTDALQPKSKRPIRLILVTHYFPAHRGGIESVAWEIARRLASNGLAEITWFASGVDPSPGSTPGVHCVPAPTCNAAERYLGFPYPLWSLAALARLVREIRRSDAVHMHDCLYLPNLLAFTAASLFKRPVVITQHIGMIPFRNPVVRMLISLANRTLGAAVLGAAAQTVFISDSVSRYFGRFARFRTPPLFVPNGVDTRIFSPPAPDERRRLRARFGAGSERPLLLFVGRFVEKKGLPLLRELTERFPRARWIFAGWGPLDPQTWSRPNVSVERGLTQEQLVPLYQAADLLVLPSVGEGFPLVVQEAMACGTPALVGEETAAGYPQVGELLLREEVDGQEAADRWLTRIESLTSSPEALESLRARVADFARANWSWERCVQSYAEILARCAIPQ